MAKTSFIPSGKKAAALTIQMDNALSIDLYQTNDNFEEIGDPEKFIMENETEENWHKAFRKELIEKGHYVPEYSTNPEWDIIPEPTI